MRPAQPAPSRLHQQRGIVMLLMLVILIVGSMAFLVSSLSKATLSIETHNKASDQLAYSKEILLGYAVNGTGSAPGNLLSPDALSAAETPIYNYDGTANSGCLNASQSGSTPTPGLPLISSGSNMRCLGRLPWQTLKMNISAPSDNDPTGMMPWYAVSANLVDPTNVPFNSELLNSAPLHSWLTVRDMKGNVLSNRVAFLIIIPGPALPGQSRPTYPSLAGPSQYLDSITVPAGCSAPCVPGTYSNADMDDSYIMGEEHRWIDDPANPGTQIEDASYLFNDRILYVTIDELVPLIEKRIAREVKKCLDDYAASSGGKYPWATLISDTTYTGSYGALFGRIPNQPNTNTSSTPSGVASTLTAALGSLQTALDNYFAVGNSTNQTALFNAGNYVVSLRNTMPVISSTIYTAGDWGREYAMGMHTYSGVNSKINAAQVAVTASAYGADSGMATIWPASCTLLNSSTYWTNWKSLLFYQIADGYKPGTVTPACGSSCLSISGSGNPNAGSGSYRAAVILAGKMIATQARPSTNLADYLEANNQLNKPASTLLETYKQSDANYSTVNDLTLCVDGKTNCQ